MPDKKFGRLFTEEDVEHIVSIATSCEESFEGALAIAQPRMTFPSDEPLFLLRGQDVYAGWAIQHYSQAIYIAEREPPSWPGVEPKLVSREHADAVWRAWQDFLHWQHANIERVKVPDV